MSTLYSLSSVGVILAGHLLNHLIKNATETYTDQHELFHSQDISAPLLWIQRYIHSNQDDMRSLLYSLDVLSFHHDQL